MFLLFQIIIITYCAGYPANTEMYNFIVSSDSRSPKFFSHDNP